MIIENSLSSLNQPEDFSVKDGGESTSATVETHTKIKTQANPLFSSLNCSD